MRLSSVSQQTCVSGVGQQCVAALAVARARQFFFWQLVVAHLREVATRRFGKAHLARGWTSWLDAFYLRQRSLRLLEVAVRRMLHATMATGWYVWIGDHLEQRRVGRLARRGVARLTKPKLATCFDVWLASLRSAAMSELQATARQAAELLEAEREAHTEHLVRVAGLRFGKG